MLKIFFMLFAINYTIPSFYKMGLRAHRNILNLIDFMAFLSQNCQNYGIAACVAIFTKERGYYEKQTFFIVWVICCNCICSKNNSDADVEQVVEAEEITIIGSRIKSKTTFDSPVPVTIVTGEDFENRLFDYAASAVTRLPSAAGAESGPNGSQAINNLRLGSQRTLVTVNGNRFVSSNGYGGGQVDVNNIPTMLIDRVEVINIGGAAVYGSDAVAGVVNYILKDDFEGFKFQYNHNNYFED